MHVKLLSEFLREREIYILLTESKLLIEYLYSEFWKTNGCSCNL